jgi:pyruvate/2-oxoglutarate dehydrogenase complex dihydrolipoamide acyltransferase (E2) component
MYEVLAPNLGQSNTDIKLEQWFKQEGEHIDKGDVLFEMSNLKLSQEVEASVSGTLVKIHVAEGETAAPGTVLAEIQEDE